LALAVGAVRVEDQKLNFFAGDSSAAGEIRV
jgi:hypothetical protein